MRYLGIDLGATFIKGAVLDTEAGGLAWAIRRPFPEPREHLPPGRYQVDAGAVVSEVADLLTELAERAPDCRAVFVCGQMHGLVLCDAGGRAAGDLITWQDTRALEANPTRPGSYYDALLTRCDETMQQALGNELRPGLPIAVLFWMAEQGVLPPGVWVASIPDFVVAALTGGCPVTSAGNAAASGLFQIRKQVWDEALIADLGCRGLAFPRVQSPLQPAGSWPLPGSGRRIPCYTPLGDQQAALLGAGLEAGELSLNIATGSQVSRMVQCADAGDYQLRPFVDDWWLRTITHIPAGRALNHLNRLFADPMGLESETIWARITREVELVPTTDLEVNLAFFPSAYGSIGAIENIRESNLTMGHLFRAAFRHMANNYARSAERVSCGEPWTRVVFSGGLARKMPPLREEVLALLGQEHRMADDPEDTMLGLLVVARAVAEGRETILPAANSVRHG